MSKEHTLRNTFGWARVEVLGMLISILALGALCFSVAVEAVQTMLHASHSDAMHHPLAVLVIATSGLLLNLICFGLVGGYTHAQEGFVNVGHNTVEVNITIREDMPIGRQQPCLGAQSNDENTEEVDFQNVRKYIVLDFVRDVTCCLVAMICACIVHFFGGSIALFADPLLSLVSVITLVLATYPFVKESGLILLQTVPSNIDVELLKSHLIQNFSSVLNVHDLHVWRLTRTKVIATAHIIFHSPRDYSYVAREVNEFFHKQGIVLATIQPEFYKVENSSSNPSTDCVLSCTKHECQSRMCCKLGTCDSSGAPWQDDGSSNICSEFHGAVHNHLESIEGKIETDENSSSENEDDFHVQWKRKRMISITTPASELRERVMMVTTI